MTRSRRRSLCIRFSGRGSANEGAAHWWRERVTAVALIPLTLWFFASIIAHSGSGYSVAIAWLRMPSTALMMVLLLASLFYHTALGLQVIIDDYVHSSGRVPALIITRLCCSALAAAGAFAVLLIVLSGG
jgi:succinate dehydrogenase / fumarate reductase membrane anchor subunit